MVSPGGIGLRIRNKSLVCLFEYAIHKYRSYSIIYVYICVYIYIVICHIDFRYIALDFTHILMYIICIMI